MKFDQLKIVVTLWVILIIVIFQSEFFKNSSWTKQTVKEFIKSSWKKWGKKITRQMRILTNSFDEGEILNTYLAQLKSTNFEVEFARILEVLGSFQLVIYPNLFFQLRNLILKIIVTFWVIIIISISGAMLAFSGWMNETESVRNRGVDSWNIRYSTPYSPCHNSSQNKSERLNE